MFIVPFAMAALAVTKAPVVDKPVFESELIFPLQKLHNHGSCVVQLPNGDLFAVWYRGSGERQADDVRIMGSHLKKGSHTWSEPLVVADTPGFPDTNPCIIVDPMKRLWLFWETILDNEWSSALIKVKVSDDYYRTDRAPVWQTEKVLHIKPGPEFQRTVYRELPVQYDKARRDNPSDDRIAKIDELFAQKMDLMKSKLSIRLGWMGRPHPYILDDKRLLLGLYSDAFDFSLVAYTDDWGENWNDSAPIVGLANVQPCFVQRKDGTLVTYMRDNGPEPHRVEISESHDRGATWSPVEHTPVVDSGAGVEAIVLKSGRWLLLSNDTDNGRYRLSIAISEDEGRTWPWVARLEDEGGGPGSGGYSYPSIIQETDGSIDVTYSYSPSAEVRKRLGEGESIKHVHFNEAWLLATRKPR